MANVIDGLLIDDSGLRRISEEVTIATGQGAAGVASSSNLAPADSMILGVAFRVTDAPGGGAATIDIGRTGGGNLNEFIAAKSCDVLGELGNSNSDNDGVVDLPLVNASADTFTLTTNLNVTTNEMKILITCWYYVFIAPVS